MRREVPLYLGAKSIGVCQRIALSGRAADGEMPLCCASCPCPLHGTAMLCALAAHARQRPVATNAPRMAGRHERSGKIHFIACILMERMVEGHGFRVNEPPLSSARKLQIVRCVSRAGNLP